MWPGAGPGSLTAMAKVKTAAPQGRRRCLGPALHERRGEQSSPRTEEQPDVEQGLGQGQKLEGSTPSPLQHRNRTRCLELSLLLYAHVHRDTRMRVILAMRTSEAMRGRWM